MSAGAARGPLLVLAGGPSVPLPAEGSLVLGSSPARSALVLAGEGVEDVHCAVVKEDDGGWSLRDLGSRTGTWVNGERVERARLWTGDRIRVGTCDLEVVDPTLSVRRAPRRRARKAAPAPTAPAQAGTGGETPRRIGGFRLDRRLGTGGMGEVWLALQESLARPVALKLLAPRLAADEGFVRRFQDEARAAAALSHPNVVVVYDVGSADGQHFLAMEYMPGGSLEERVAAEGALPWREAVASLRDAAHGLEYAEARGIVHRDVKPANLMRTGSGAVKLADLGLATTIEAEASESDGKKVLGTPHFMAPEQVRGAALDHRTDLYALGATAYRLLTGRTPFQGRTTRDILRAHLTEEPAPPSTVVPGIPAALDAIVMQLLAKEPDGRPSSARAVVAALDAVVAEGGAPAGARRRAVWLAGAAVVLIAAAAFLYRSLSGGAHTTPAPPPVATGAGDSGPGPSSEDTGFFRDPSAASPDAGGKAEADPERKLQETLRLRDLEAQVALASIPDSLEGEALAQALRDVAAKYPGTPTADKAGERLAQVQQEIAAGAAAREAEQKARAVALDTLAGRIGWPPADGAAWNVGAVLKELLATLPAPAGSTPTGPPEDGGVAPAEGGAAAATEGAPAPPEDPALTRARAVLAEQIVARALAEGRAALSGVDTALAEGRFDDARAESKALAESMVLPALPEGFPAPAGWDDLAALADSVQKRAAGLDAAIAARTSELASADRARLGALLGPGGSLETALRAGTFDSGVAALGAFIDSAHAPDVRARADGFRTTLQRASDALALLASTFRSGEWRRSGVVLRERGRDRVANARACDATGVTVDADGAQRQVPWSTFLSSPDLVSSLFDGRLSRHYTLDEERDVLAVLCIAGALHAADLADQVLVATGRTVLSKRESEDLAGSFAPAQEWVQSAGPDLQQGPEAAAVDAEARGARALAEALVAYQDGRWGVATAALTRLLRDRPDTLLVALLSDGSLAPPPAPAPPPTPSAEKPAKETSSSSSSSGGRDARDG